MFSLFSHPFTSFNEYINKILTLANLNITRQAAKTTARRNLRASGKNENHPKNSPPAHIPLRKSLRYKQQQQQQYADTYRNSAGNKCAMSDRPIMPSD